MPRDPDPRSRSGTHGGRARRHHRDGGYLSGPPSRALEEGLGAHTLLANRGYHTDSGRRTRPGFLGCCEAGRLVRHESRRRSMARVAGHLSGEDLEAGFRSARDPTAARHVQVIWLLARGHTIADVAAVTSFVPRWIEQLLVLSELA